jgi:hypothetical protein
MKSRLTLLTLAALFAGACTTGTYVTSSYTDDIYFNPGDVPPPITIEEDVRADREATEKSAQRMIISDIQRNQEGSQTMNNYIFEGTEEDADALVYSMDQYDLYQSDTTVYYNEDDVKYVINNYYDGDALDYAYRIRRFHRPHFYDPFYWDSWYYDSYLYDPFYYSSWHSPYYSWGWGSHWYSPYSSWGWGYSPYYSYWNNPYYGGFYGGYYGGYPYYNSWYGSGNYRYADSENYRYGQRRSTGTNVLYGNDNGRRTTASGVRSSATTAKSSRTGDVGRSDENAATRRNTTGVRETEDRTQRQEVNSNVVTERRRTDVRSSDVKSGSTTQTYTRPGSSQTTRTYTRPATNATTTPRVVTQSRSSSSSYTAPRSTSTYNRTYRTNSTYNRSSSSSSATRTYRAPSTTTTKSGSTYQRSTPTRSSSSGSYRSSGSSSGRSYTPSSSGSSGTSRSSSSSSSSSGRRR